MPMSSQIACILLAENIYNLFEILTLTFKCLQGNGPKYLCDLLVENKPVREGLRSQKLPRLLVIP